MNFTKKIILFLFLSCFISITILNAQQISRPKLVVGIAVDQMRWDYLYRYYPRYQDGGFKRLLNEGFSCENTFINYLPSYTAVGHTTIFTGSVPAIDGITGNDWIDQITGRKWYCTEDTTVSTVGSSSKEGQMSPRNLLVSTITDELRVATNFQSRVVGVSLKDRASILPAGHTANGAFWFDDESGNFVTSTYYMKELPAWANNFNKLKMPEKLSANEWNTLFPVSSYTQSTADDVSWEGLFKNEKSPVFPHRISALVKQDKGTIRSTPFGNTLTLDFAKAAIEGYNLGNGKATDFLTVNCASTDYVGHKYGPNSIEVEDVYLRLDRDLASFFSFLDNKIGKGNYLVFISADHGAANSVGFMEDHNIPADLLQSGEIETNLVNFLHQKFGVDKLISSSINSHLSFDMKKIEDSKLDYEAVKKATVSFLQKQPGVQFAVDIENIGNASVPEPIKTAIINGYNSKRTGPVIIIPEPGWYGGSSKTGTTHGNWNPYDTHIPLVFFGWHIPQGNTNRKVNMTDISATLAALLHIQQPNGCVGEVITELTSNIGGK
jgi:predicted AlkP superfamily pyrophosphatase or phosphodiesterase